MNSDESIAMNWKILKNEADYNKASIRLMEIFHAAPNTSEGDELELLLVLNSCYLKLMRII